MSSSGRCAQTAQVDVHDAVLNDAIAFATRAAASNSWDGAGRSRSSWRYRGGILLAGDGRSVRSSPACSTRLQDVWLRRIVSFCGLRSQHENPDTRLADSQGSSIPVPDGQVARTADERRPPTRPSARPVRRQRRRLRRRRASRASSSSSTAREARAAARFMLSKPHGQRADRPEGVPVSVLLVAPACRSPKEYYVGITVDRGRNRDE